MTTIMRCRPGAAALFSFTFLLACRAGDVPPPARPCESTISGAGLCQLRLGVTTREEFTQRFCAPTAASTSDERREAVLVHRYQDAARTASLSFWFRDDVLVHVAVISSADGDVRLPACLRR